MFAAAQNSPTCSIARIAQNTSVGTAGSISLSAVTSQPILVGEYVVVWVSNKAVNSWAGLFGPTDANGLYTIPGQSGSGQVGSPNIQARNAGGIAAHLIWAQRITTTQINSGTTWQVIITSGSGTLISVYRVRGASLLDMASSLAGNSLTANVVYNLGSWRDTAYPVGGFQAGYRRNLGLIQLITVGQANNILNGVTSNFSLVDNVTFGSGLSPSSQRGDLTYWDRNDPVSGSSFLGRWPLAVTNATITGMRFCP